jgi:transposase
MKEATHILGIDIAKNKFDVNLRARLHPDARHSATFHNNAKGFAALQRWLVQHGAAVPVDLHACLESTSRYGDALANWLYTHAYQVSLVNPRRTRHYANSRLARTLNDQIDAALIADFCAEQRDQLALWEPLPAEHRQLQDLTRARQALVEHREGFANLLETATGPARKSFQRQMAHLDKEIQRLEAAIQAFLKEEAPGLQSQIALADSVPGVGLITAATVVAELPPIAKLARASQAIALFGLDPKNKTSGTSVKTPARLSKMGSKRGRRALYMPALVALRHNPVVQALGQRLKQRGRSGKYVVVAAMRKLLRLIFGVIKSGKPFDPLWAASSPAQPQTLTPA